MLKRKELAGSAKKIIKTHYWFLLIVCLIAAFIGSEFTETFNLLKMYPYTRVYPIILMRRGL